MVIKMSMSRTFGVALLSFAATAVIILGQGGLMTGMGAG